MYFCLSFRRILCDTIFPGTKMHLCQGIDVLAWLPKRPIPAEMWISLAIRDSSIKSCWFRADRQRYAHGEAQSYWEKFQTESISGRRGLGMFPTRTLKLLVARAVGKEGLKIWRGDYVKLVLRNQIFWKATHIDISSQFYSRGDFHWKIAVPQ